MATVYFDLPNVTNGTGTSASPKNATGWAAQTIAAGDTYKFKRATTSASAAFTLTAGTAGNLITWDTWYNADGTDDTSKARPVLVTSTVLSTLAAPADYVTVNNIEISAVAMSVANDKALIFMGTSSTVHNCIIDTNIGVIGVWDKSTVEITNNQLYGVSHSSANNNNVVVVSGTTSMSGHTISFNTIKHKGGGGTTSHGLRVEATTSITAITSLVVHGNSITTSTGALNVNTAAIGMRLQRTPAADISSNTINYYLSGIFCIGGGAATALTFQFNTLQYNAHFGLHLSTDCVGCTVDSNNCSFNGTSTNDGVFLFAYGRGIECSSAAGQAKCSGHTIRFNTCNGNLNYGGPLDNASEGVGIGLDDGTSGCTLYGNTIQDNEGNGIQYYGGTIGSGTPAISDTGGNNCVGNFFKNNCAFAVKNRRTGGTTLTLFVAHIGMATVLGSTTNVCNNVFVGTTPVGIGQDGSCTSVLIANNVFLSTPHALMFGNTISVGSVNSNDFFSVTQKFCLNGTQGDGSPSYATKIYTGTNDLTFDPSLTSASSPSYFPPQTSAVISAGFAFAASQRDFVGRFFNATPSIGMYEFFGSAFGTTAVGGRNRKAIGGRR